MRFGWLPFIILWLVVAPLAAAATPPLRFDPPQPSFGRFDRSAGINPRLRVAVINASDKAVSISDVQVGCGCISGALDDPRRVIKPDERTTLTLELNLAKMMVGRPTYQLAVKDGTDVIGITTVSYEYNPAVEPSAGEVVLSPNDPSGTRVRDIDLIVRNAHDGVVATTSSPLIGATIRERVNGRYTHLLTVEAAGQQPSGRAVHTVAISVGRDAHPALMIPVRVQGDPRVRVEPAVVLVGSVRPGIEVARTVTIAVPPGYRIRGITPSASSVRWKRGTEIRLASRPSNWRSRPRPA